MSETESFESVMDTLLNGFTHDVRTDELSGSYKMIAARLDRLRAAHEREILYVSQQSYHSGFNAGQHSMDAEHRAIAMRLRHLPLDGGSHENLSQIARAVYHADFGWTQGACAALRDKLVRLMGGVSDGTAEPMTTDEFIKYVEEDTRKLKGDATGAGDGNDTCACAGGGACADSDGGDSGKQVEVSDGRVADDSDGDTRGSYRGVSVHMDGLTAYDVLDNERRKAIAELRKCDGGYTLEWDNIYEIFDALGVDYAGMAMAEVYENLRDRLIHLLGGNLPSGIDMLRAMDGDDGTCPNDVPTSSITDELRECVDTATKTYDDTPWHEMGGDSNADHTICYVTEGELLRIADRIDEQFDRICQQHEDVLQKTVDEMVKEYEHDRESDQLRVEKLEKQRDHWHQQTTDMMNHADAMEHERDEAYARTDELSDELLRVRRERDELRAKMAIIREAVDG